MPFFTDDLQCNFLAANKPVKLLDGASHSGIYGNEHVDSWRLICLKVGIAKLSAGIAVPSKFNYIHSSY